MAVDVSRIPNNNKFDPVREAILQLQSDVTSGVAGVGTVNSASGNITITDSGNITVNTVGTTITIGIDDTDYFSLSDTGTQTITGNVVISGNLTVNGTTVYLNTETVRVEDNIIELNRTPDTPNDTATASTSGIEIYRGNGVTTASFIFDDTDDTWDLTNNLAVAGTITTGGDEVITLGDLSISTSATPSGGGALSYDDTTGVFTFTPADAGTGLTLQQVTANGNSTTYGISTGNITVQPSGTGSGVVTIQANSVGDARVDLTPGSTAGVGVIKTTIERGISFQPNSTEKVVIASDGNMNVYEKLAVGKTTAASTYHLEVDGTALANNFITSMTASGTTYTGTFSQYYNALQIRTVTGGTISLGGSGPLSVQNNVAIKDGDLDVNGDVTADFFIGDGSQLTNLPGGSADLQDVTDNGATTTNPVTFQGTVNIDTGQGSSSTDAYTAYDRIVFDNAFSDVARGANKIVFYDSAWLGGIGVHDDTVAYYSGGEHIWYESNSTVFSQKMRLTDGGSLITQGRIGISGQTPKSNLHIGNNVSTGGFSNYTDYQILLYDNGVPTTSYGIGIEGSTMMFNSDDYYRFYVDNSQVVDITSSGIGIGTTTPAMGLHVAQYKGFLVGNTTNWDSTYISPQNENTINTGYGYDNDTADLWVNYRGYQDGHTRYRNFQVGDGKGSPFASFIGSTGRVGIGTTSPSRKFVVSDGGNTGIEIDPNVSGTAEIIAYNRSNSLYQPLFIQATELRYYGTEQNWYSSGSFAMRLTTGGSLGIGTASPAYKLDVAGSSGFRDTLRVVSGSTEVVQLSWTGTNNGVINALNGGSIGVQILGSGNSYFNGGNVGIGTSSPSSKLTVFEAGVSGIAIVDISGGASGAGSLQISAGRVLGTTSFDLIQNSSGAYVYQRDSNPLIFGTSNTERMRIDSSGNVGIGESSLTGGNTILDLKHTGVSRGTNIRFKNDYNSSLYFGIAGDTSGDALIYNQNNSNILFYTGAAGTEKMRITSAGNVGIGNVGSNAKLEVTAVSGEVFRADASGGAYRIVANQSGVNLNGNVGIGTGTPVTKLDVTGDIHSTVGLRIGSATDGTTGQFLTDGTNTYLDYNGFLSVRRSSSSAESVRIDSSGNVAIGTATPLLTSTNRGSLTVNGSVDSIVTLGVGGTHKAWFYYLSSVSNAYISTVDNLAFEAGSSVRMYIASGGNVGINDTTPNAKTSIVSSDSSVPTLRISNEASGGSGFVFQRWAYVRSTDAYRLDLVQEVSAGLVQYRFDLTNNSTTYTSNLVLDRGNVGIGTTSPGAKLDIHTATNSNGLLIREDTDDSITHNFYVDSGDNGLAVLYANGQSAQIQLNTAGNSYFNGGNVGIGTSSPGIFSEKLTVNGDILLSDGSFGTGDKFTVMLGDANAFMQSEHGQKVLFGAYNGFRFSRATSNNKTVSTDWMTITDAGNVGIGTTSPSAKLQVQHNGSNGASGSSDYAILANASSGQATIGAIHTAGGYANLNLGSSGSGSGLEFWHISYRQATDKKLEYYWYSGGFTSRFEFLTNGDFKAGGDVIAYKSSDERLKDNIKPIENAIDKVKAIGGYEFDWNDNQESYEGHDVGVIAQEIEEVLPEVVTTRDTGYKAVQYEKLVPLLIEAIKEQQKQIDELKVRLDA